MINVRDPGQSHARGAISEPSVHGFLDEMRRLWVSSHQLAAPREMWPSYGGVVEPRPWFAGQAPECKGPCDGTASTDHDVPIGTWVYDEGFKDYADDLEALRKYVDGKKEEQGVSRDSEAKFPVSDWISTSGFIFEPVDAFWDAACDAAWADADDDCPNPPPGCLCLGSGADCVMDSWSLPDGLPPGGGATRPATWPVRYTMSVKGRCRIPKRDPYPEPPSLK